MKFAPADIVISPVTGRIFCDQNYVLFGNGQRVATPSPILIDIRLDLKTFFQSKFILGQPNSQVPNAQALSNLANGLLYNSSGNLTTVLPGTFAPNTSKYILQQPDSALPNSQALSGLSGGILKSAPFTGVIDIATADFDYCTPATVSAEIAAAEISAIAAAATASTLYFGLQMLPFTSVPLITAGAEISASIAAAAALGVAAQVTANNANTRIDGLTVTFLNVSNNLSDISSVSTARSNLGLTNVATQSLAYRAVLIGGTSNSIVSQELTNGQLLIGSTGSLPVATVPASGNNISWTTGAGSLAANISGQISLANGGTNANLTASNGGVFYSTASAAAILPGVASPGRFLVSGYNYSAPSWSQIALPTTLTSNQILYASEDNVIAGLPTEPNSVLTTNFSGILNWGTIDAYIVGEYKYIATSVAPPKFLLCNGDAISRTIYAALHAVIGNSFGSGNGSTTFNLPDLRGNVIAGAGATYVPGGTVYGADSRSLTLAQLPVHNHNASSIATAAYTGNLSARYIGGSSIPFGWYGGYTGAEATGTLIGATTRNGVSSYGTFDGTATHNHTITVNAEGASAAVDMRQKTMYAGYWYICTGV